MGKFNKIYPFTTEMISGYMSNLNLVDKKIITVAGSADHIINAILKGCTQITTFDVNPITKHYLQLKLAAIEFLNFNEFLDFMLYDSKISFNYDIICKLKMDNESKNFWISQLQKNDNDGLKLKHSAIFNLKYFNAENKIKSNLYLNEENYNIVKNKLKNVKIKFFEKDLKTLKLDEHYDYMFLSNISDYIESFYEKDVLKNYKNLIYSFLKRVNVIYFAYIYDIEKNKYRSVIDDIENVKTTFGNIRIETFDSALVGNQQNIKDAILIKGENYYVRK